MAYTLFFNPMSRALIAQWGFAEAGVEPELAMVEWDDKPAALLEAAESARIPLRWQGSPGGRFAVSQSSPHTTVRATGLPGVAVRPRKAYVAGFVLAATRKLVSPSMLLVSYSTLASTARRRRRAGAF